MKEYDLHKMIDLYFDAQLSLAEEEELFEKLLSLSGKDRMADEALAVMLVARGPVMRRKRKKTSRFGSHTWSVAAAVALLVGIGTAVLLHSSAHDKAIAMDGMVAYV